MLTQEKLKEILFYEPKTGLFTRKITKSNRAVAGSLVLNKYNKYMVIGIDNKNYYLHRLAWLYIYGEWPKNDIDHINGIKSDNRIENLRDVTKSVNMQNLIKKTNKNQTDYLGVSFCKKSKKWYSRISVNKKQITIGRFNSPELAYESYLKAKRELHIGCTI
jgi:hypothetical protein